MKIPPTVITAYYAHIDNLDEGSGTGEFDITEDGLTYYFEYEYKREVFEEHSATHYQPAEYSCDWSDEMTSLIIQDTETDEVIAQYNYKQLEQWKRTY